MALHTRLCTIVIFLNLFSKKVASPERTFRRVCYFTNWSCDLLEPEAHFCLRHIDTTLCTHVVYAFAKIDVTSVSLTPTRVDDEDQEGVKGRYVLFNELLKNNSCNVKTLLSVGGLSQTGNAFKSVSRTAHLRTVFAHQCALYLRRWGFDGLDLDWEYPDGESKGLLPLLLEALSTEFTEEARRLGEKELILSIAAPVSSERVKAGYDVPEISKHAHMINLMAYDFHGAWSDITGANSPLYPKTDDPRFSPEHSVEWSVNHWIALGSQPDQINLGVAGYGQAFTLKTRTSNSTTAPLLNQSHRLDALSQQVGEPTEKESLKFQHLDHTTSKRLDYASRETVSLPHRVESLTTPVRSRTVSSQRDPQGGRHSEPTVESAVSSTQSLLSLSSPEEMISSVETPGAALTAAAGIPEQDSPGIGSPSAGPGKPGRLRHLSGQLSYPEICELVRDGARVSWDDEQCVPYLTDGDQWVGYDDVNSVALKVTWAVRRGLGGVMFWSLDLDDFKGDYCGQGRYPLLSAINRTVSSLTLTHQASAGMTQGEIETESLLDATNTDLSTKASHHLVTAVSSYEDPEANATITKQREPLESTKHPRDGQSFMSLSHRSKSELSKPQNESTVHNILSERSAANNGSESNQVILPSNERTGTKTPSTVVSAKNAPEVGTIRSTLSRQPTAFFIYDQSTPTTHRQPTPPPTKLIKSDYFSRYVPYGASTEISTTQRPPNWTQSKSNIQQSTPTSPAISITPVSHGLESVETKGGDPSVSGSRPLRILRADVNTATSNHKLEHLLRDKPLEISTNNESVPKTTLAHPISPKTPKINAAALKTPPHYVDKMETDVYDHNEGDPSETPNDYYYYIAFKREFPDSWKSVLPRVENKGEQHTAHGHAALDTDTLAGESRKVQGSSLTNSSSRNGGLFLMFSYILFSVWSIRRSLI